MDLQLWITFVSASVVLLLIPGPTVLLVLSYSLSKGRSVAVASAMGVALGDLIAMSASLAGLGALVLASATLFSLLKWLGAAYLVWLGIKLWHSAGSLSDLGKSDIQARGVFAHAAVVTALNPKSIAFFIAFVPQFLRPSEPLMPQFMVMIATFVGLAALNALVYALAADRLRRIVARPGFNAVISRMGGGALIAMGILTASLRKPA
ncbi:LysE family translocator [Epibacterium sp. SM1969]|uniref:LysE family translocator n=1 Tax=Tritonibacter aquimaris TaxID=2663379 RepID=A0A844ATK3_9RHOB|nr:LysE family translocator [Tritonibacter aquimaris]MQY43117.1 LysE family translocator [Tritonibacter aquimaris]